MIYAIIQARTGSRRLPNKVLMEFCNKPNLYHVYQRVRKSKAIDKIIIATTDKLDDDRVCQLCLDNKIDCFRGNEEDVLDRFYQCCVRFDAHPDDIIVRITADCPLIDPYLVDRVIDFYIKSNCDYASNTVEPTYPDGLDVEVFSFRALKRAWEHACLSSEREHVTPYIRNNSEFFKIGSFKNDIDLSHYRWTLDEIEDYQFINIIYENLYNENRVFTTEEVLRFLKNNSELEGINSRYIRNEGYLKSLTEDNKLEKSDGCA